MNKQERNRNRDRNLNFDYLQTSLLLLEGKILKEMKSEFIKRSNMFPYLQCYNSESFIKKTTKEKIRDITSFFWKHSKENIKKMRALEEGILNTILKARSIFFGF